MPDRFEQVDRIFERVVHDDHVPGIAYGVVIGGQLAHARGIGTTHANAAGAPTPDADSVFRIASMTKSFTAAMTLLLRDEGVLGLDDAVGIHVPELDGFKGPTADSPLITLRHLLTMAGGLPTDDPWGDRLQGLPLDRFSELLADGFEFAWTPGTAFEYSNLGYGILGRSLSNASGVEYRELVRQRMLEPLGLSATCYDADSVPSGRLVQGHTHRDDAFIDEPLDGYGALASMGGIFSSVRDLATWVAGFADAFLARDATDAAHPLGRASRREMQQVHRSLPSELEPYDPAQTPPMDTTGYGLGLFVQSNLSIGHVISHSGGYPGFGSHMRWNVPSGIGVIALGNRTYAPMHKPCTEALVALVNADVAPVRTVVPWSATLAARAAVERLLAGWDDALAERLLAANVDLDEPLERRRAACERVRERFGALTPDGAAPVESDSPAHLAWWMRGALGGRVRAEILLTPERPPRVQALELREVGEPSPAIRAIADRVGELLGEAPTSWPEDLVPSGSSPDDREAADRTLRAAAALCGRTHVGEPTDGDGTATSTFPLTGDRGSVTVRITLDEAGQLTGLEVRTAHLTAPIGP